MGTKKRNAIAATGLFVALSIAFIFDIKYKGLVYRTFNPRKVQS